VGGKKGISECRPHGGSRNEGAERGGI